MTETQLIYQYLLNNGHLNSWVDPQGVTQPAPEVQLEFYDENVLDGTERCLLIRNASAGAGSRYTQTPTYIFAVMGKTGEPYQYAQAYIEIIRKAMQEFTHSGQLISLDPIGRIGGPYQTESGRIAYDINYIANVDSSLVV